MPTEILQQLLRSRLALLLTLGGSVAQTSLVQALAVGGATPDLPFIMTVFWALRRGPEAGCAAGFSRLACARYAVQKSSYLPPIFEV